MLPATQKEIDRVTEFMRSQAPDLTVDFMQKVYSENVLHVRHDVWDVHTNVDRWWIITEPMKLYAAGAISEHGSSADFSHRAVLANSAQRTAEAVGHSGRAVCGVFPRPSG